MDHEKETLPQNTRRKRLTETLCKRKCTKVFLKSEVMPTSITFGTEKKKKTKKKKKNPDPNPMSTYHGRR